MDAVRRQAVFGGLELTGTERAEAAANNGRHRPRTSTK